MHSEAVVSGIRRLCIGLDMKLNRISGYVCMCVYIRRLCGCISGFFYITGQHWLVHSGPFDEGRALSKLAGFRALSFVCARG